jgi:RNA polymerase sigma factor (TIGR02999 family)
MGDVTRLLHAVDSGDAVAKRELFDLVYPELRRLAGSRLARESTLTDLDAGSLVNEACLRLLRQAQLPAANRRAFFGYACSVMRSVIVDYVRQRQSAKRGSGEAALTLLTRDLAPDIPGPDVTALDAALQSLETLDARCARVVELRFFGGLDIEEVAETLDVSRATVIRDWEKARLFLYQALKA